AEERARQDRWPEAARLLEQALRSGPADARLLGRLALAQLKAGDRAAHAGLCQGAWRDLPPKSSPGLVAALVEVSVLSPGALADWTRPLALAEEALRGLEATEASGEQHRQLLRHQRRQWLTMEAALLHRAGREGAVSRLQEAMKLSD